MRMLITLLVMDVDEACAELATKTGKARRYSQQRVSVLIQRKIGAPIKIGRRYFLTEEQIDYLAAELRLEKRPRQV